jgi:PUA domain protein
MRNRDARNLLQVLSKKYGKIDAKKVEVAEFEDRNIYFLDELIEFVKDEKDLYPYLGGSYLDFLPKVVVDMGAIPFVCNGADIMAPGIVEVDSFQQGSLVVVRDVTHGKALAVGKSIKSSTEIESEKKGKVIKNLHYVGDKFWENASL